DSGKPRRYRFIHQVIVMCGAEASVNLSEMRVVVPSPNDPFPLTHPRIPHILLVDLLHERNAGVVAPEAENDALEFIGCQRIAENNDSGDHTHKKSVRYDDN